MESSIAAINRAVAQQYDTFPFPNYGLFLPLRWQEGYASHSSFAHVLAQESQGFSFNRPEGDTLIAGCGDVFPSIACHWEPSMITIHSLDLSRKNLMRARIRCLSSIRRKTWTQLNLDEPLPYADESFSHIDSYGVLHHLANPRQGLRHLAQKMAKGGTLRLMVYNSTARHWIHQIQKIFAILELSPYDSTDRKEGLLLLENLSRECPSLQERLQAVIPELRSKPTRLVDTFFHAREVRMDIVDWFEAIRDSGLQVIGLFDRYAELDDLPNPLYHVPSLDQLRDRCLDRRFENNWELYLLKAGNPIKTRSAPLSPVRLGLRSAPLSWFSFAETKHLNREIRKHLWRVHLSRYSPQPQKMRGSIHKILEEPAIQRLLRIGAIWPSSLDAKLVRDLLSTQLYTSMDTPESFPPSPLAGMPATTRLLETILIRKRKELDLLSHLGKRLVAAQKTFG